MISNVELESLFEALAQTDGTLDEAYAYFIKPFTSSEPFRSCCVLINMLNHNMLSLTERIMAEYFVIMSCKSDTTRRNPFSANLLENFERCESAFEKKFMYNTFLKGSEEYGKLKIKSLPSEIDTTDVFKVPEDYLSYKKALLDSLPQLSGYKGIEIGRIVVDHNLDENNRYTPPQLSLKENKIDFTELEVGNFQPDFLRPIPIPLEFSDDEPNWLNPGVIHDIMWDTNMCVNNDTKGIIKELLQKGLKTPLNAQEIETIKTALQKDPKLVFHCDITPDHLPLLVEVSPPIAANLIVKLFPSAQISQYLEKLAMMELTLGSLEVVNQLCHVGELPKEFLYIYITNCMKHCENLKKDSGAQKRLVRLVCVFIKSLIKNKILNPKDMFIDLHAFSIEFIKVQEAAGLFKMLKQLDGSAEGKSSAGN